MARLHLAYREEAFNGRLLELTRRLLKSKPWGMNKRRKFETWLHGANLCLGLPEVRLAKVPLKPPHGQAVGWYNPATKTIHLAKWSLISLFHQYRHHMQACADPNWTHVDHQIGLIDNSAQDAQEWACSLLYIVAPKTFRRAVRNNRVAGVTPPDLLRKRVSAK